MSKSEKIGIFFGCTTAGAPALLAGLEGFLAKAKIDYVTLGKDICCGVPLLLSGYEEETRTHAKKVENVLSASGVNHLVTSCPHCYMMFSCEFPERFGIELGFDVLHFVEFADRLLKEGKIKLKNHKDTKILYHDPCGIGRRGKGLFDEPRHILAECAEVVEADRNRIMGTCCGGGGLLRASLPKLAVAAAKRKIVDDVLPKEIETIVTSCPFCTLNLSDGAAELDEQKINVFDFPQFLLENMEEQ